MDNIIFLVTANEKVKLINKIVKTLKIYSELLDTKGGTPEYNKKKFYMYKQRLTNNQ